MAVVSLRGLCICNNQIVPQFRNHYRRTLFPGFSIPSPVFSCHASHSSLKISILFNVGIAPYLVETKTRSMIDKCLAMTAYDAQYRIPWIVFDRDEVKINRCTRTHLGWDSFPFPYTLFILLLCYLKCLFFYMLQERTAFSGYLHRYGLYSSKVPCETVRWIYNGQFVGSGIYKCENKFFFKWFNLSIFVTDLPYVWVPKHLYCIFPKHHCLIDIKCCKCV